MNPERLRKVANRLAAAGSVGLLPLVALCGYDVRRAWRIADLVVDGELDNTVKGRVTGWLRLAGRDEPVRLELRGNCWADLAGWRFRIVRLEPVRAWAEPVDLDGFATEQIGEAGDILADQMLRHYEEGERRLEELRHQGYLIEETPLGVLCYHKTTHTFSDRRGWRGGQGEVLRGRANA